MIWVILVFGGTWLLAAWFDNYESESKFDKEWKKIMEKKNG
jgi:hypothetical protein